jgi:ribosomal protein S18 acetylase RimI-like enzyme
MAMGETGIVLDFGSGFVLRRARSDDHAALAMVCLKTGDAGKDASAREDDPDLLGLIYTIPYQIFAPDLAFMVEGPQGVCGYLLGAVDTRAFNARLLESWYPPLQARFPDPSPDASRWRGSDWARHWVHHPDLKNPSVLDAYPSHGHIDLLASARGRGIGRKAMNYLERKLAEAGSPGLHLQVMPENRDALSFYAALGFVELRHPSLPRHCVHVVKRLAGP